MSEDIKKIDRFEVLERIGTGGMARIFKAKDPNSNQMVALKVLHSYLAEEDEFVGRFEREFEVQRKLDHPAIVKVAESGVTESNLFYIVMEYLTGGTLKERIDEYKKASTHFTFDEILSILKPIASALTYAHKRGVIHRDVKPANIMFDLSGKPHITDFGIVRLIGLPRYTLTGVIAGTPSYMAPEQAQSLNTDYRSDTYSLGIILYQLITGHLPFTGETPLNIINKHLLEQFTPIETYRDDLPRTLSKVLEKVLAKDPEERYSYPDDFIADLEIVLSQDFDESKFLILRKNQFFDYLRDIGKGSFLRYEGKLLIIGEGGVGKSSLLRALQDRGFVKDLRTTHGIDIQPYRFPHPDDLETIVTLNVWDFGGQQIYHTSHQFFMTQRSLYLLVWNARGDTEQGRLDHWLRHIQVLAPDAPIIIVATHVEDRPLDFNYSRYKDTYPQVVNYVGVSSRDGNGIDELKRLIAQEAAKMEIMEQQWPKNWVNAEIALSTSVQNYLSIEEYISICEGLGVSEEIAQTTFGSLLHDLGKILYFQDDIELSNLVVLRPNWLTVAVSRVLDDEAIKNKNGILNHNEFPRIWEHDDEGNPYEHHLYARFLRLMERFLISYRLEPEIPNQSASQSLVPLRLNHAPPPIPEWSKVLPGQPEIKMVFIFRDLVPPGIMSWFIVLTHSYSQNINWREGVRLYYKGHQAEARLNSSRRELWLFVKGPAPYNFFNILQHTISDRILEKYFRGLVYFRKVPCNCSNRVEDSNPCSYFHDYERLVARRVSGKLTAECNHTFKEVSVIELLEGIHFSTDEQVFVKLEETKRLLSNLQAGQEKIINLGQTKNKLKRANIGQESLILLNNMIAQRFNEEELRNLCFHLSIDYEDIPAIGKSNKARELILMMKRHNQISHLISVGERFRPDIEWKTVYRDSPIPSDMELLEKLKDKNQLLSLQNSQYFEQLNRSFLRYWNHFLRSIDIDFPSLLLLVPQADSQGKSNLELANEYSIQLLCQYPAGPHVVCEDNAYRLKDVKINPSQKRQIELLKMEEWLEADLNEISEISVVDAWFSRISPWLGQVKEYLSYIQNRGFIDDLSTTFISKVETSIKVIDKALLKNPPKNEFSQPNGDDQSKAPMIVSEKESLQMLHNFLRQKEEENLWCGLQKISTNDGNIFWLCEEHRELFESL